jgi:futalosine hydrolase
MEGYSVALAAMTVSIPCTIVRGICNVAGDRDHAHWQMGAALAAVQRELTGILTQ